MKKIIGILFIVLIIATGCFKRDQMEDINIITTIYPIEYVTDRLYGESSNITSIYPRGSDIDKYTLTKKQIKDYSEKDLFIYSGESSEREYATSMLNQNNNLKIIDASYGLEATYSDSDIWLDPSNILMISQNIKTELEEYITSTYIIDEINEKYNSLKVDISGLDTEFKTTADNALDSRIIVADESLNFLRKYGFTVINLTTAGKRAETNIALAESLIKTKKLNYVFVNENTLDSDIALSLVTNYKAKTMTFKLLSTISEDDLDNNEDYLSLMHANINLLKEETYK